MKIVIALLLCFVIAQAQYLKCLKTCRDEHIAKNSTKFGKCFAQCNMFKEDANQKPMSDAEQGVMDTTALWNRYRRSLFFMIRRKTGGPMTDTGLQMVTEPMDANWHNYEKNLAFIANRVSAYGSIYTPTQNTLPKQYEMFLNNLNIVNNNAPQEIKQAHNELSNKLIQLETDLEKEWDTCATQYEEIRQYTSIKYDEFEKLYCPNVDAVNENIRKLRGKLVELNQAVLGEFADVYTAISDMVTDNTTRGWSDFGSLARFIEKASVGQADTIEYSLNSQTDISETRVWFKQKKSGFLFFKKTKTESKREYRFESEHFDMSIKAQGFAAIRIYPQGKWFKPILLSKYKSTDYWKNKSLQFFGDGGSLSMMPLTLYVMYKPAVVLNVSQKDGYFFESNKQSSFFFGPFASKSGSVMKVEKTNENNYRVTFETNAEEPQIVAIENHVF